MTFRKWYAEHRKKFDTKPRGETLTDQSQAKDCDINIIVKRNAPGTMVAGSPRTPIWGADLVGIPADLASAIQAVRGMERLRGDLPEQFRELAVADLMELTPERIREILTPPAKPADSPEAGKEDSK